MSVHKRDYLSRLQTLLVFFNFEWHGQNEVGNIGILVLWRDCENSTVHRFHNWLMLYTLGLCIVNVQRNRTGDKFLTAFITGRNEVVAKVIFLHLFVILFTGGVCLSAYWDTTPPPSKPLPRPDPPEQTPPRSRHPPPGSRLQYTVYERPVRILLECIFVFGICRQTRIQVWSLFKFWCGLRFMSTCLQPNYGMSH